MLQKNPLAPPRPLRPTATSTSRSGASTRLAPFVSAEDFDSTGILAGVDPCESRYWWLPDLVSAGDGATGDQATSRSRPTATA